MQKIKLPAKNKLAINYFLSGGFWLLIAQGITILGSLSVAIFFADILSENQYGTYRYVINLSVFLIAFSLTGVSQSILQATSQGYTFFFKHSLGLTFRWTVCFFCISIAGAIYYKIQGNETLSFGCLLIAFFQPMSQLFINTIYHLYGQTKFKEGALIQSFKSVIVSCVSLLGLYFTQNIVYLLAVYFTSQACLSISIYLYAAHKQTYSLIDEKTKKHVWEEYLAYAKHTSLRNLIVTIALKIDTIIIFQFVGASELALYSIAALLPEQIRGGFKNIQTLILPKYTQQGSFSVLKKSLLKRSFLFFLILVCFTIILFFAIPFIYTSFFPKYYDSIYFAQLLTLTFPASIFLIPISALQAHKKERELYIYHTTTSVVQILLLFFLILTFGVLGAIYARIVTQYLRAFLSFVLVFYNKD